MVFIYLFILNWLSLQKQCVESKGNFSSVHKPEVNAFLKNFVQNVPRIWIDGNYATRVCIYSFFIFKVSVQQIIWCSSVLK